MMTWDEILKSQQECEYFQSLQAFVENERKQGKVIYPPAEFVYSALDYTPFEQVKVVILGQDPYHGEGQAHGLAFSVSSASSSSSLLSSESKPVAIPPSLRNMYKALVNEYPDFQPPSHGYLKGWADQGVLLLNTVLTVEQGKAHSHASAGWETLTDHFIEQLNQHKQGVVFLLWGAHAQKKGQMIDSQKHLVLNAPHPSPLSAHRGFFTCGHFSQTNAYLKQQNLAEIDWTHLPA